LRRALYLLLALRSELIELLDGSRAPLLSGILALTPGIWAVASLTVVVPSILPLESASAAMDAGVRCHGLAGPRVAA
jgi:hypothetical protein